MHDLHLADKILKTVLEVAEKNKLKKVDVIKIELGDFIEHGERITPENLQYNFSMLSKDTSAEKAQLVIASVLGQTWCLRELQGNQ